MNYKLLAILISVVVVITSFIVFLVVWLPRRSLPPCSFDLNPVNSDQLYEGKGSLGLKYRGYFEFVSNRGAQKFLQTKLIDNGEYDFYNNSTWYGYKLKFECMNITLVQETNKNAIMDVLFTAYNLRHDKCKIELRFKEASLTYYLEKGRYKCSNNNTERTIYWNVNQFQFYRKSLAT